MLCVLALPTYTALKQASTAYIWIDFEVYLWLLLGNLVILKFMGASSIGLPKNKVCGHSLAIKGMFNYFVLSHTTHKDDYTFLSSYTKFSQRHRLFYKFLLRTTAGTTVRPQISLKLHSRFYSFYSVPQFIAILAHVV